MPRQTCSSVEVSDHARHQVRGRGEGACINGTAYVLEITESRRREGGGTLLQKARAAERKSSAAVSRTYSSPRLWVASLFFLHSRYSLLSHPCPTTKPPAAVLYSRPKNLHFTETERAKSKRQLQQRSSFFSLSPPPARCCCCSVFLLEERVRSFGVLATTTS